MHKVKGRKEKYLVLEARQQEPRFKRKIEILIRLIVYLASCLLLSCFFILAVCFFIILNKNIFHPTCSYLYTKILCNHDDQ